MAFVEILNTAMRFRSKDWYNFNDIRISCYRHRKMIIIFMKLYKNFRTKIYFSASIVLKIDDSCRWNDISISTFAFIIGTEMHWAWWNLSWIIVWSNLRGFESVCASRWQTGRHFKNQLNSIERRWLSR